MKTLFIISLLVINTSFIGQDRKETNAYFDLIKQIVRSEKFGEHLIQRLDTLESKFIPSRSGINDYFNRDIEFGFKHRRINMRLNFADYQVDLLCYNDTIFLSSVITSYYNSIKYDNYNKNVIEQFLKRRNRFYNSSKTPGHLIKEISSKEEYAFYCGDGSPKTQKGKYIEQLVEDEDADILIEMLKSFNCETQSYGVSGFNMLSKKNYKVPLDVQKLIDHIKKRDSKLVVCSGCLLGLIDKIYSKK